MNSQTQSTINLSHFSKFKFLYFFAAFEILIIIFYILFVSFKNTAKFTLDDDIQATAQNEMKAYYALFQDVHVMIFIGFGFLMTYLKSHSWTSVATTFVLGAFSIQWGILCLGFFTALFHNKWSTDIEIDIKWLVRGDFMAGTILISFGGMIGKFNLAQYLMMAFIECIFAACNVILCEEVIKAIDMGGSMYIHCFGAYFGIAMCLVMYEAKVDSDKKNASSYISDLFAMVGTIFLWLFWPSFNTALASGTNQQKGIINTVLSITSSCIIVIVVSPFFNNGKLKMDNVLNATLAGGVIMGASSDLMEKPYTAMFVGCIGGMISLVGFEVIASFLNKKIHLQDTAGIHNLHGMPGLLGGLISAIAIATCGDNIFYERASFYYEGNEERTCKGQAGAQIAAVFVSFGIAIIGGLISGFVLKMSIWNRPIEYFDDTQYWVLPDNLEDFKVVKMLSIKQAKSFNAEKKNNDEMRKKSDGEYFNDIELHSKDDKGKTERGYLNTENDILHSENNEKQENPQNPQINVMNVNEN